MNSLKFSEEMDYKLSSGDWTSPVGCPVCKDPYIHFSRIYEILGRNFYKSGTGFRGDVAVISCWCENGHKFDICFAEHKGQLYPFTRPTQEETLNSTQELKN